MADPIQKALIVSLFAFETYDHRVTWCKGTREHGFSVFGVQKTFSNCNMMHFIELEQYSCENKFTVHPYDNLYDSITLILKYVSCRFKLRKISLYN